jgi:hypothetical protein
VEQPDDIGGPKRPQAWLQESSGVPECLGNLLGIGVVRQIAAGPARHQDFDAGFPILF